jgi:hypothetical protein
VILDTDGAGTACTATTLDLFLGGRAGTFVVLTPVMAGILVPTTPYPMRDVGWAAAGVIGEDAQFA